ncbi:hypothetical protein G4B88_009339 [Cannabis sativa]|uniref:Uncharacterized protein n=1 Tax=Cannabis sativa TaxID=3483 RepID=A0A7J6FSV6_CANSA|nr:hypothetical protein G4B88_009339 [Cannabis sativa]
MYRIGQKSGLDFETFYGYVIAISANKTRVAFHLEPTFEVTFVLHGISRPRLASSTESTSSNPAPIARTPLSTVPTNQMQSNWNTFYNSLTSVIPTMIGHELDKILLVGNPPLQFLVTGEPNPEYNQWKCKDQLLLSWLRSSMIEGVLTSIASFSSSHAGGQSISDYVDKTQAIADSLTVAGSPILDQDLILQLLNGLGSEYDPVVSWITARSDVLTFEEVQALLLCHESRLEHHSSVTDLSMKLQANVAFTGSRNPLYRPPHHD